MWIVIKNYKNSEGKILPVLMLNGLGEILEFETQQEAFEFANILKTNTDSGWDYIVKKVGK